MIWSSCLRTSTRTSATMTRAVADHTIGRSFCVGRAFRGICLPLAVSFNIFWTRPVAGENPEVPEPSAAENLLCLSHSDPEPLPVPQALVPHHAESHTWAPRRRFGPVSHARVEAWQRSVHPEPLEARFYGGVPFYYPYAFGRVFYRSAYGWPYRNPRGFGTRLPAYHGTYPIPW